MSKSREQLIQQLRKINITGKSVIDIGVQDKPARLLTIGTPTEYKTTDIDDKWNPDFVSDLNTLTNEADTKIRMGQFDIVFCIEVLEHCWDPVQAVKNLSYMLKPGGDIYISTPFINPHHDEWDYLRLTDEWYELVLDKVGIDIVQIYERKATAGLDSLKKFYQEEGMKYSKIRQVKKAYTYPVGYFIHGRRKETNN